MNPWFVFLLIIGALFFAALSVWRRDWAIYLILVSLPSYLIRFKILGIPFTYLETLVLILFFSCAVTQFFLQKNQWASIRKNPYFWPIIGLWLAGAVSVLVSPDRLAALGLYRAYIIEPVLFFMVFIVTIRTKRQFKTVIWSLGILAIWVSLIALVQFFTGIGIPDPYGQEVPRRATSIFPYPNAVSLLLTPIFLIFSVIFMKVKFFRRSTVWWGLEIIILSGIAILASMSEGAWMAILVTLGVVALTTKLRWKILIASGLVILMVMILPVSRDYVVRLFTFRDVSGDVRLALWQGTWNMLRDRPLFGAGLAGFPSVYPQYKLDKHVELLQYPHNIFLDFWSELGLLGLLTLLWLLVIFFGMVLGLARKKRNDFRSAWPYLSAMVGIILYGLVDEPYFKNDLSIIFWTIIGLMTVIVNMPDEDKMFYKK